MKNVNHRIFRGYDLRGLVDEDLSEELALNLGKAFGSYLQQRGISEAVVGRDSRASGPAYSKALIEGLSWAGIDVIDIGMVLIGTFYWSQYFFNRRGGVYVSASHNPPNYNGFKFANDFSETLVTAGMQEMLQRVTDDDYQKGTQPGKIEKKDIKQAYFQRALEGITIDTSLKVVVDPSCSTAGAFAPDLLRQVGVEVIEYNTNVDSSFPLGTADPTETHVINRLSKEVVESGADVGFTFDADGDRIGIVDENGEPIWNDKLVAIFACDVLAEHPGATIMYNLYCSKAVKQTIEARGGVPYQWRVGHSFLKKKNQEVKAAFIGELSGHFFFSKDFYNHDDGLYSMLRVLQYISRSKKKLSELAAKIPEYVSSPEIKIGVDDDKKVAVVEMLAARLKEENPGALVIDDERAGDGLRIEMGDAMFVIRYSQNGPYCGMKFEAKSRDEYEKLRQYILKTLKSIPEFDFDAAISGNTEALEVALV